MTATLVTDLNGRITVWKKGQVVKAKRNPGGRYTIERAVWKTPKLPLFNILCNVPKCALRFHRSPLINTGLQPGASVNRNPETVSTVSHH